MAAWLTFVPALLSWQIDDVVIRECKKHLRAICGDCLDKFDGDNYKVRALGRSGRWERESGEREKGRERERDGGWI